MDNLDNKTAIQPDTTDLQAEFEALRHLVVSILILLIVVSGTFSIYLLRQWRTTSKDLPDIRRQVASMIDVYQKNEAPYMQEILKRLTDYGRTHPDYQYVLTKYNVPRAATTSAPPVSATPPTPGPQKK